MRLGPMCLAMAAAWVGARDAAAQTVYPVGFVWKRAADWTARPEADQGSTRGNPDDDGLGVPVWCAEYVELGAGVGGIGSDLPWYVRSNVGELTRMVWDGRYLDSTLQAWARSDDAGPFITQAGLFHVLQPVTRDFAPISRFAYDGGCAAGVRVRGTLSVIWTGIAPMSNQSPDDVALVIWRAGGQTEPLLLRHLERPSGSDTQTIWVDARATLQPGDSLVLTHLGTAPDIRNWIFMSDALSITLESSGPAMVEPPARTVMGPHGDVEISIGGRGAGVCRWYRDEVALSGGDQVGGSVITGVASRTLLIRNVGVADQGRYHCVVSGPCGTRASTASQLVVCAADVSRDGVLDLLDFFDFLNCMEDGFLCADVDGDAQVTLEDFFVFFSAWDQGC